MLKRNDSKSLISEK